MNVPQTGGTRVNKYYARAVTMGHSTLAMIAQAIQSRCTVTRPDILAVMAAFVDDVYARLMQGQIVELGELGNMQLLIHNNGGAETKEEWTPSLIKKAVIIYRPSLAMKKAALDTAFQRWSGDTKEETATNGE
jgi:predicted histone-like DNA-binding protein